MLHRLCVVTAVAISWLGSGVALAGPTVRAAADVGITADTLCASGISVSQAEQVLARVQAATAERASLAIARTAYAAAARELSALHAQIQADPLNLDLQQLRDSAEALVLSRQASLDNAREALRQAVTTDLQPAQAETLTRLVCQGSMRAPTSLRAGNWTSEQRKLIEIALVAEQRAQSDVTSLPAEVAQLLAEARADAAVLIAAQSLSANLSQFRAVFSSWQN